MTAVSWGNDRIDIFARGSDNALWQEWFDGTTWHTWTRLGGDINSSPTVSTWGVGRLDVFSTGPAGDLQHYWYDSSSNGWQIWESLGQPAGNVTLSTGPGSVSWGPGRIDVFGRGSDGVLWQRWFDIR